MFTSTSVLRGTAKSRSPACPKCGTTKIPGKLSCCGRGGAWFHKCGDAGDKQIDHTWDEGIQACKSKFARVYTMPIILSNLNLFCCQGTTCLVSDSMHVCTLATEAASTVDSASRAATATATVPARTLCRTVQCTSMRMLCARSASCAPC